MGVVVAGEALIDLAPRQGLLAPLPGGSPYNVAVGLARLGVATGYLGGLSTDGFGQRLAERLAADGVDLALAARVADPTTLAVVHLDEQRRASYGFYLEATAATSLGVEPLPALPDGAALHVSLGAIGLAHRPSGVALAELLRREHGARRTSLDPNVRPTAITQAGDVTAYAEVVEDLLPAVDLVKASDEDLAALAPGVDPLDTARRWAGRGPASVVVTRGPDGAVAVRADGTEVAVAGEDVEVVDTVGAGDAFTSGLLAWLDGLAEDAPGGDAAALVTLDDAQLRAALTTAVHVAALTCTRAGSDPPRRDELDPGRTLGRD